MSFSYKPATLFVPSTATLSEPCYLPARKEQQEQIKQKYHAATITRWHDHDTVQDILMLSKIKKAESILYVPLEKDRDFDITHHANLSRNHHTKILLK